MSYCKDSGILYYSVLVLWIRIMCKIRILNTKYFFDQGFKPAYNFNHFDNKIKVTNAQALISPVNGFLSNVTHDQDDTHQCWAYTLATMLRHSRTGIDIKQDLLK